MTSVPQSRYHLLVDQINPYTVNVGSWAVWTIYWFSAAYFARATKSSEGLLMRSTHLLPAALGFFLIFHSSSNPLVSGRFYDSRAIAWLGDAITVTGLLFAVWARIRLGRYWSGIVTLKEGHKLIRTGPYQWVRHPIYTGFLAAVLGSAIMASTGDSFIGCGIVVAAYLVKIWREENLLTREFGEEYRLFKLEVSALVPFIF